MFHTLRWLEFTISLLAMLRLHFHALANGNGPVQYSHEIADEAASLFLACMHLVHSGGGVAHCTWRWQWRIGSSSFLLLVLALFTQNENFGNPFALCSPRDRAAFAAESLSHMLPRGFTAHLPVHLLFGWSRGRTNSL
jgi:hypothetical protein